MQLKLQGKITSWNDEKEFGFITPASGYDRIFVHIKSFRSRHGGPQINQYVSFVCSKDKQGRPCAIVVEYIGKQSAARSGGKARTGVIIFVGLFFAALGILTFVFRLTPTFVIALFAIVSAVTFITYALDKSAAQKGRWRIAEATLHAMSFFGGWPGGLIAQQTLRHKSRKKDFQWEYKATVIMNIALTTWLLTPRGPELTLAFIEKPIKTID